MPQTPIVTTVSTSTPVLVSGQLIPNWVVPGSTVTLSAPFVSPTIQIFATVSSGTYTPTAGMQFCIIECIGGGGGGGGVGGSGGVTHAGGGGGAGGYSRITVSASVVGASKLVTVGAGGQGSSNGDGTAGGDTSVDAICIGKGGSPGTQAPGNGGKPGAGGVAGTGDVTAVGAPGGSGYTSTAQTYFLPSGFGGSSVYGGGAASATIGGTAAVTGKDATNYGGGGSGGVVCNTGSNVAGGNGSKGVVIITEL